MKKWVIDNLIAPVVLAVAFGANRRAVKAVSHEGAKRNGRRKFRAVEESSSLRN